MNESNAWPIDRFLGELEAHVAARARGPLADLRRGFSAATEHRAWPYLARFCRLDDEKQRAIWRTIGAGFATVQATAACGNLGRTMRDIALGRTVADKKDDRSKALKSFDGRFRRLITCRMATDVCERLPGILRAAERQRIAVDFRRLYWDLWDWDGERRDVPVEWAAAYWGVEEEEG